MQRKFVVISGISYIFVTIILNTAIIYGAVGFFENVPVGFNTDRCQ